MDCRTCENPIADLDVCCFATLEKDASLNITKEGKCPRPIKASVVKECYTCSEGTAQGTLGCKCVSDTNLENNNGDNCEECDCQVFLEESPCDDVDLKGCTAEVKTANLSGCIKVQVSVPITGAGEKLPECPNDKNSDICCTDMVCVPESVICINCAGLNFSEKDDCCSGLNFCYDFKDFQATPTGVKCNDGKECIKIEGKVDIYVSCPTSGI